MRTKWIHLVILLVMILVALTHPYVCAIGVACFIALRFTR